MKGYLEKGGALLAALAMVTLAIVELPLGAQGDESTRGPLILHVGVKEAMKSRNPLPAIADDVWTHDVLDRVYDTLGRSMPDTEEIRPYIVKGIDADENGVFDTDEYSMFVKETGTNPLDVVAYYDFNGVYFHDGVQANASDLFFSYQLHAMSPFFNVHMRVLMDKAGKWGSNYSSNRWLFMSFAQKNWQNEPAAGSPDLRFAVRYILEEPFALFANTTLAGTVLFPRHIWEGTGWRQVGATKVTPLHEDFGMAIYPEWDPRFGKGVPLSEAIYKPYAYLNAGTPSPDSAVEWQPNDADVIGTGPFQFNYFDDIGSEASVLKYADYYYGRDSKTGVTVDPQLTAYIHLPFIDGISFLTYASSVLMILALQSGQIDYICTHVAPEFMPELINHPGIKIWMAPDFGFNYIGYNMRRPSVGYWHYGQVDQFDVGLHFRKAIAHLIDKSKIVKEFLQGYGVPGVVPVSPMNTKFYNTSVIPYSYSLTIAQAELDLAHQDAVWLSMNGGPPEAATWYSKDPGTGRIIMPGIGTATFNLWCPNAGFDPVLANSCVHVAAQMQQLGINIQAKPTTYSAVRAWFNAHDFDMYLFEEHIQTIDPDYLFDEFHASNAAEGRNHAGFNDATSDAIMEMSRTELDESRRIQILKDEQGFLAGKLPYDTLFFRTNIEAERQDNFIGWIEDVGSIWNYWSLMEIHPPGTQALYPSIVAPSAMASGDTKDISVAVRDSAGSLFLESTVTLTAVNGGNFTGCGGPPSSVCTGMTVGGLFQVSYQAPDVTDFFNVTIAASAEAPNQDTGYDLVVIEILPPGTHFLAVTLLSLDGETVFAGSTVRLKINVTDETGMVKGDAMVSMYADISLSPPSGYYPSGGTAIEMEQCLFVTPVSRLLQDERMLIVTYAVADLPGYRGGDASLGIFVVKTHHAPYASFNVTADGNKVGDDFNFDASNSSDYEDPSSDLEVRWDWENDGVWDTAWSTVKVAHHRFTAAGTYTVRLEVRDTEGMTHNATRDVVVEQEVEPTAFPWLLVVGLIGVIAVIAIIVVLLAIRGKKRGGETPPPSMPHPPTP